MAISKFLYEDLGADQFENLVTALCQQLFGFGVQGFATGPDGGRDAKFIGTASSFPNPVSPWSGITIIQAKHTNGHNKSFAETDFFNPSSDHNVIAKEVPRIVSLRSQGKLDNYLLVANRRLPAGADDTVRDHLIKECGLSQENIFLCGIEQLDLWLKWFPQVAQIADLDPVDAPLLVSPDQISDVVNAFSKNKTELGRVLENPPVPRLSYEKKNEINNMTPGFAKELRRRYLKEEIEIATFLSNPENADIRDLYDEVVEEFNLKIIAKRKHFQDFDSVFNYLIDLLFARDPILRQRGNKQITRAFLFYMYWHCDIGETEYA